jgi:hypothetical protein
MMRSIFLMMCVVTALAITAVHAAPLQPVEDAGQDRLQPGELTDQHRAALGGQPVPLVLESMGIAMYRPRDTEVSVFRADGQTGVTIEDGSESPQWSMTIQHLHSTLEQPTAQGQIETHLTALREAGHEFRELRNEPYAMSGTTGHLAMIEQKTGHGEMFVQGWLIVPAGARVFLVFSVLTLPESVTQVQRVLDACWSTCRFRSAAEISLRRRSRIETGREVIENITPEQLQALDGKQVWLRIYRAADPVAGTDDVEIGYSLIEVARGLKGELHPERRPEQYLEADRAEGLIVRVHGRMVADRERDVYFDSQAIYWMAWDQSEEAWSVRGVQRQRRASRGETETGLRLPQSVSNPRPRLQVIRSGVGDFSREPHEWLVPDVYLSQPIAPLLGYLLPMDGDEPLEFASYYYNYSQSIPQLTQRIDTWEREGGGRNWQLTTRLTSDAPPTISVYSPDRRLIRRTRADGTLIEPSTPEQIHRIWQRRGLDTGGGTGRR